MGPAEREVGNSSLALTCIGMLYKLSYYPTPGSPVTVIMPLRRGPLQVPSERWAATSFDPARRAVPELVFGLSDGIPGGCA